MVSDPPRLDEVWLVSLDPAEGSEMEKTRPCLVVSPNETNRYLRTAIVAPMTTAQRPYPTRVALTFQGRRRQVALDQLRAVDASVSSGNWAEYPRRPRKPSRPRWSSCLLARSW